MEKLTAAVTRAPAHPPPGYWDARMQDSYRYMFDGCAPQIAPRWLQSHALDGSYRPHANLFRMIAGAAARGQEMHRACAPLYAALDFAQSFYPADTAAATEVVRATVALWGLALPTALPLLGGYGAGELSRAVEAHLAVYLALRQQLRWMALQQRALAAERAHVLNRLWRG